MRKGRILSFIQYVKRSIDRRFANTFLRVRTGSNAGCVGVEILSTNLRAFVVVRFIARHAKKCPGVFRLHYKKPVL